MADSDNIGLLEIRVQVYDVGTNSYLWHNWWVPQSWSTPFEGDWLSVMNVLNIAHFRIPNKNAVLSWKIKGTLLDIGGSWNAKVRVGDSASNYIEYNVPAPDENGDWELTLPALGENNACWVWYSLYNHTPPNAYGLTVHNAMRVISN